MRKRRAAVVIGLAVALLAGCATPAPIGPTPTRLEGQPTVLPGSAEFVPAGLSGVTGWQGTDSFPGEFDADATHETLEMLGTVFIEALRTSWAGSPQVPTFGLESLAIEGDRALLLVTEGGFRDDSVFGTQYALVAAASAGGWRLDDLYVRALCRRGVTDDICV